MKVGEKWRPYRSMAAWYFWRALDGSEKVQVKKIKKLKRTTV
jgi:3-methyladenine DNA glycosylase/8-oxoguanine DNA glycosylase